MMNRLMEKKIMGINGKGTGISTSFLIESNQ
jgi:hypothetical protein